MGSGQQTHREPCDIAASPEREITGNVCRPGEVRATRPWSRRQRRNDLLAQTEKANVKTERILWAVCALFLAAGSVARATTVAHWRLDGPAVVSAPSPSSYCNGLAAAQSPCSLFMNANRDIAHIAVCVFDSLANGSVTEEDDAGEKRTSPMLLGAPVGGTTCQSFAGDFESDWRISDETQVGKRLMTQAIEAILAHSPIGTRHPNDIYEFPDNVVAIEDATLHRAFNNQSAVPDGYRAIRSSATGAMAATQVNINRISAGAFSLAGR